MTYNPDIDKPKAVVLLRTVRHSIATRKQNLICFALERAEYESKGNGQSYYLKQWVELMLAPSSTYGGWIRSKHPHLATGLTPEQFTDKAREARLAWIDWMIGEIQK